MTDAEIRARLQDRLQAVEARILAACGRAGRVRSDITLVAVTKGVGIQVARLLPELGLADLGESRPQELWKKAGALKGLPIRWHMIGHLQRNKIKPTIDFTTMIHSVDSLRLLEELNAQFAKGFHQPVLLEVNASREPNKHGFAPEEVATVVTSIASYPDIRVEGLMTMAAYNDDPQTARSTFREVRRLRDELALKRLSMGMSNDFEVAIEEGATLIRLGTILFEGLPDD
jgi:pyridoxal phosphate enzyme (YggS family)